MKNKSTNLVKQKLRIGFFDSGHGGLGLLKEAMSREIDADFFYVADLEHLPYGEKTEEFVKQRCLDLTRFLLASDCDAIVVACNTATAVAVELIRSHTTVPIIGVEPYLNFINKVSDKSRFDNPIAALVTPATFNSKRLKELQEKIDPQKSVGVIAMPGLAAVIEDLIASRDWGAFESAAFPLFEKVNKQYKTLLLGCTHYPLVSKYIEMHLNVETVCPTKEVIDQLVRVLGRKYQNVLGKPSQSDTFSYTCSENDAWKSKKIEDFLFWD